MLTEQEVIDELSHFYRENDARIVERPPVWQPAHERGAKPSWRMQLLATAAVLLLLLAVGLLVHEARLLNRVPAKSPAPKAQSYRGYQAMLGRDVAGVQAAIYSGCDTTADKGCPPALVKLTASVQRMLDDLNTVPPPPRLAGIIVDLRLHFASIISNLNAAAVDFQAGNQDKMHTDISNAGSEWGDASSMAADIAGGHQVTIASYKQTVANESLDKSFSCPAACQQLLTQAPSRCVRDPNCESDAKIFQLDVESTLTSIASVIPPAELSAQDMALVGDLSRADVALRQMISVLSAGTASDDQTSQISSAQSLLASALNRFRDDTRRVLNKS
jgi:hypothetical protein